MIDKELNSKHPPTRSVLWDEYKMSNPGAKCYSYSHFNSEISLCVNLDVDTFSSVISEGEIVKKRRELRKCREKHRHLR
ncbi:MAG: hypothetical protein HKL82_07600 [Acidimicrobiaceae bacterium]|nr:hypothetical protein [Acidimicrobiaceae bacterium]